jgi:ATP-dependent DNA ligase
MQSLDDEGMTGRHVASCVGSFGRWNAEIIQRAVAAGVRKEIAVGLDEDGPVVFRQDCRFGFKGIVSKRLSARYRSGQSHAWRKIKNTDSPAMVRHREGRW